MGTTRTYMAQTRYLTDLLLQNADEFFDAWEHQTCPPPLRTRAGIVISHAWPTDPVYLLFQEIFLSRCYTGGRFYQPRACDVVVDVGANIGMFAMHLLTLCPNMREIHCFEPSQDTRNRLTMNIKSNNLGKVVSIHPLAIWSGCDSKLLLPYSCSGRKSFFNDGTSFHDGLGEKVGCLSLSAALDLCGVERCDFLKVDVEGAEVEILQTADHATWSRIARIALEYHEALRPGSKTELIALLRNNGFDNIIVTPHNNDEIGIIQASR